MPTIRSRFLSALAAAGSVLLLAYAGNSFAVPSFARQTGMACQACHTVFPELTPFGRLFKLNAYTIDNLPQVQGMNTSRQMELMLNQLPPLSVMLQTSYTKTKAALPDGDPAITGNAQNGQVLFPQQLSLFYAGRIAPNMGTFIQMTYEPQGGAIALDNTEIRYAKQADGVSKPLTFGVTLNNNPTVQDVWNSTPAWQIPFDQSTSVAPTPGAATQIDGTLVENGVTGITAYLWWQNSIYAEFGLYKSSPQGWDGGRFEAGPLDSTTPGGVLTGWAPYWRLAYEKQWGKNAWSVGAYGLEAKISPQGQAVGSPTDGYRDVAVDEQYQYIDDDVIYSLQATAINERQTLDASFAAGASANPTNKLKTLRIGGSYFYRRTYGASLGYFSTKGSSDAGLYAPNPVDGFANNSPDSNGYTAEFDYLPYQNVKFALQYVTYLKFNGASSDYDGSGRNASDNNTLYLLGWFAF